MTGNKFTVNDGGPAFPVPPDGIGPSGEICRVYSVGLTMRDWFAGMALPHVVTMGYNVSIEAAKVGKCVDGMMDAKQWAETAYEIADAMIAERAK